MPLRPGPRKALLIAHILAAVGWMGAVAAFVVLDVTTVVSDQEATLRAAYVAMDLVTVAAIVPLAVAALVSGIAVALLTPWGLFRHWWVVVSLVLTVVATLVLLVQLPTIAHRADVAADAGTSVEELRAHGNLLLHSVGGTVVLLVILALNVAKPRGLTRYGWRKQQESVNQSVK